MEKKYFSMMGYKYKTVSREEAIHAYSGARACNFRHVKLHPEVLWEVEFLQKLSCRNRVMRYDNFKLGMITSKF
jgi:hypothetical protein